MNKLDKRKNKRNKGQRENVQKNIHFESQLECYLSSKINEKQNRNEIISKIFQKYNDSKVLSIHGSIDYSWGCSTYLFDKKKLKDYENKLEILRQSLFIRCEI